MYKDIWQYFWLICTLLAVCCSANFKTCDEGWALNSHGEACVKLFNTNRTYTDARDKCTKHGGRLLEIPDKTTNDLAKRLVQESNARRGWIGLSDLTVDGTFYWSENSTKILGKGKYKFEQWDPRRNHTDGHKSGVYIARSGWWEAQIPHRLPYICEKTFDSSPVSIACPGPTLEGTSSKTTCNTSEPNWDKMIWTVHTDTDTGRATNQTECYSSSGCVSVPGTTARLVNASSSEFTVQNTLRGTTVTCEVSFRDNVTLENVTASNSCNVAAYYRPDQPSCAHQFKDGAVHIICTTEKIFPKAKCRWDRQINSGAIATLSGKNQKNSYINEGGYFKWQCSLHETSTLREGKYTYTLTIFPNIPGIWKHPEARRRQKVTFVLEAPKHPGKFLINGKPTTSQQLVIAAGTDLNVTCSVVGGQPTVYQTTITCDDQISKTTDVSKGTSTSLHFSLEPDSNFHVCKCYGTHIVAPRAAEATTELSVQYGPALTNLTILGDDRGTVDVKPGRVELFCAAKGNPLPSLDLFAGDTLVKTQRHENWTRQTRYLLQDIDVGCEDWMDISCRATSSLGLTRQTMALRVLCKPHFIGRPANPTINVSMTTELVSVIIDDIVVYPPPIPEKLLLYRYNEETNTFLEKKAYSVSFQYSSMPHGFVTLNITSPTEADLGKYRLAMDNSITGSAYLHFRLVQESESHSSSSSSMFDVLTSNVPVTVVIIVVIIIIIILIFVIVMRRRAKKKSSQDVVATEDVGDQVDTVYLTYAFNDDGNSQPVTNDRHLTRRTDTDTYTNMQGPIYTEGRLRPFPTVLNQTRPPPPVNPPPKTKQPLPSPPPSPTLVHTTL